MKKPFSNYAQQQLDNNNISLNTINIQYFSHTKPELGLLEWDNFEKELVQGKNIALQKYWHLDKRTSYVKRLVYIIIVDKKEHYDLNDFLPIKSVHYNIDIKDWALQTKGNSIEELTMHCLNLLVEYKVPLDNISIRGQSATEYVLNKKL